MTVLEIKTKNLWTKTKQARNSVGCESCTCLDNWLRITSGLPLIFYWCVPQKHWKCLYRAAVMLRSCWSESPKSGRGGCSSVLISLTVWPSHSVSTEYSARKNKQPPRHRFYIIICVHPKSGNNVRNVWCFFSPSPHLSKKHSLNSSIN